MPNYIVPTIQTQLPPQDSPRRVVIVTNSDSSSLEYLSFLQAFTETTFFLEQVGQPPAYEVEIVSRGKGTVYEVGGLSITVSMAFDELRGDVDTLIVQAVDDDDRCLEDERFIGWIRMMATRVRRVVSACTGSFLLAEAGLLDGGLATTHWAAAQDFRDRYPKVVLIPEQMYIKSGNVYTAAGVTAAMDLAIALIEEDLGPEMARRVAQAMVAFMRRPGGQAQFSAKPTVCHPGNPSDPFVQYILEHIDENLRLESIADHFSLSLRTFNRKFRKQVGLPPGKFIEQCRVERARLYLEDTVENISQIAYRCGYQTYEGLCLAFERHLGITPTEYRKRFATPLWPNGS